MKDQWYADKRDLVKWGVLLKLAEKYGIISILQVAYFRPTQWGQLTIDGEPCDLPQAVIDHFRRVGDITSLKTQVEVIVFDIPFTQKDRSSYHQQVLARLPRLLRPAIIFLDPDTGLEPSRAGPKHVGKRELREIWNALRGRDVLVFYQHRARRPQSLREKQDEFEKALGVRSGESKVARGSDIASDVAFFYCRHD